VSEGEVLLGGPGDVEGVRVSPYWSRSRPAEAYRREWPPLGDGDPVPFDVFDRIAQWQVGDRGLQAQCFLDYIAPGSCPPRTISSWSGWVNIAVNAWSSRLECVVASDHHQRQGVDQLCLVR